MEFTTTYLLTSVFIDELLHVCWNALRPLTPNPVLHFGATLRLRSFVNMSHSSLLLILWVQRGGDKLLACRIWECTRKCQSNVYVGSWITADLSLQLIQPGPSGQRGSALQKNPTPDTPNVSLSHIQGTVTAHKLWLLNTPDQRGPLAEVRAQVKLWHLQRTTLKELWQFPTSRLMCQQCTEVRLSPL